MERGGRGLNAPSSFPGPGGDSHALATQVLIKARRRSVQITMCLHIERGAEGGRGRREAQRAPRGRTTGPRAAALKGIHFAGSRAEPNRAEPSRAQRRGAQAAGALAQPRGSGCIASRLWPPPLCCLPRRLPGAPPSAREQLPLRALTLRLLLHFSIPHALASSCHRLSPTWRRCQRPEPKSRLGNSAPSSPSLPPRPLSFPSSQRSPLRASWEM